MRRLSEAVEHAEVSNQLARLEYESGIGDYLTLLPPSARSSRPVRRRLRTIRIESTTTSCSIGLWGAAGRPKAVPKRRATRNDDGGKECKKGSREEARSGCGDRAWYKRVLYWGAGLAVVGAVGYFGWQATQKTEVVTFVTEDARVGDTITHAQRPAKEPVPGFKEVKPQVFAGLYPVESNQYEALRDALTKLQLNDAALKFEPEVSQALGFGFRAGFLGLLHMDIVQERLEREYNMDLITTAPSVVYEVLMTNGDVVQVENPSKLPPVDKIEENPRAESTR